MFTGKPGPGRPKGSKDKKWATLEYWFTLLNKDLADTSLPISDKVKAELKMIELILGRKPLPSDTPAESVDNAKKLLEELNNFNDTKSKADSDQGILGSGNPPL